MVGVPGRSKGCHTCKQRKIACSLEKPDCRTCIKSGRICSGYQRERIFILDHRSKGDGPRKYQKRPADTSRASRSAPKKVKEANPFSNYLATQPQSHYISRNLSPSTRSIYRQQILNGFLSLAPCHLPQIAHGESALHPVASWLTLLATISDVTPVLETSILALCTATLGRVNMSKPLVHESHKFYTQGLWELQRALWDPKSMYTDETLASCMILIAYEVTECPDQNINGWLKHMKGCSKLFELRGPKAYESDFSHLLFSSFRLLEIQQAITERRRTYLSSSEWTTLPWKSHEKNKLHEFLDVMVQLPDIIAEGYDLYTSSGGGQPAITDPSVMVTKVLEVIRHAWELDAKLRAFYADLERENPSQLYWPELSLGMITTADETELGKVFPVAFQFLNIKYAHICMLYWATTAILWAGMVYMYNVIAGLEAQQTQLQAPAETPPTESEGGPQLGCGVAMLPPLDYRTDLSSPAKNICQTVEYSILHEDQSPWSTRAVFPLKVCVEAFHDTPGCEREKLWSIAAIHNITEEGVRILGHLSPEKLSEHAFLPG